MAWIREVVEVFLSMLEEIDKAFSESRDFRQWEQAIYRVQQEAMRRLLRMAAERLDEELMREGRKQKLKMINRKERTLMTPFGEITLRRRYYRDEQSGAGRFLLDEALGVPGRKRLSPWCRELAVQWATELPYQRASHLWSQVSLGAVALSPQELWEAVQEVGQERAQQAEARREAMFERGEVPQGERQAPRLCTEADEVLVRGRGERGKRRHVGLKVSVSYEGKEEVGSDRRSLQHRRVRVGVKAGQAFWEETVADDAVHWDLSRVEEHLLGGDGAEWVKQGVQVIPKARYRLDRYHLRKALLEGLAHDEEGYQAVSQALVREDRVAVERALKDAERRHRGAARRRIRRLATYLLSNWHGIVSQGVSESLGTIEGQIFHHVARRMKRHGARWSERGADHLGRLLAAKANEELEKSVSSRWPMQTELLRKATAQVRKTHPVQDSADWLRAALPALANTAAGDPLRHALRALRDGVSKVA